MARPSASQRSSCPDSINEKRLQNELKILGEQLHFAELKSVEILSQQKMKSRIGPLARLDCFVHRKNQFVCFQPSPNQFNVWADTVV